MQWSITRGVNKSIIASRKFYDNDTIKAVLEMRLDYEKVLEPFMSQLTDNTGGMIQDDNGNIVYAECSMDKKYRPKRQAPGTKKSRRRTFSATCGAAFGPDGGIP